MDFFFLSENSEEQTEKMDGRNANRGGHRECECAAPNIERLFAAAANLFVANPLFTVMKDSQVNKRVDRREESSPHGRI